MEFAGAKYYKKSQKATAAVKEYLCRNYGFGPACNLRCRGKLWFEQRNLIGYSPHCEHCSYAALSNPQLIQLNVREIENAGTTRGRPKRKTKNPARQTRANPIEGSPTNELNKENLADAGLDHEEPSKVKENRVLLLFGDLSGLSSTDDSLVDSDTCASSSRTSSTDLNEVGATGARCVNGASGQTDSQPIIRPVIRPVSPVHSLADSQINSLINIQTNSLTNNQEDRLTNSLVNSQINSLTTDGQADSLFDQTPVNNRQQANRDQVVNGKASTFQQALSPVEFEVRRVSRAPTKKEQELLQSFERVREKMLKVESCLYDLLGDECTFNSSAETPEDQPSTSVDADPALLEEYDRYMALLAAHPKGNSNRNSA